MFCPQCGTPAEGAAFCPSCGASIHGNPVTSPSATSTPAVDPQTQLVLSGWWARVGATIIDSLILLVPSTLLAVFLPRYVAAFVEFAYLYFMWMRFGATIGNRVTNTKVVSILGGAIDSSSAVVRALVLTVPTFIQQVFAKSTSSNALDNYATAGGIGAIVGLFVIIDYLYPLFDKRRQSIHDKAAKTLVVKS